MSLSFPVSTQSPPLSFPYIYFYSICRAKKLVFGQILPYWAEFFWYWCFSLRLTVFLPPLPEVQCPNHLDFQNPWKEFGQKWSQIWKLLLIKGVKLPRQKKFLTDFFNLLTLFKCLFVPIFRSSMSKLFRFSESLGKTNVKKWSQIWKLLLINGVKSPRRKKFFLLDFSSSFVHSHSAFLFVFVWQGTSWAATSLV